MEPGVVEGAAATKVQAAVRGKKARGGLRSLRKKKKEQATPPEAQEAPHARGVAAPAAPPSVDLAAAQRAASKRVSKEDSGLSDSTPRSEEPTSGKFSDLMGHWKQ